MIGENYDAFEPATVAPSGKVDICAHITRAGYWPVASWLGIKTENTGPEGATRNQQVLYQTVCNVEDDNIYHKGTCRIERPESHNEYSFDDICIGPTTVAECYVAGADAALVGIRYESSSRYYWESSPRMAVPRYAYTKCPSGYVCSEGACIEEPPAGTLLPDHDERQIFPAGPVDATRLASFMKFPPSSFYRVGSVWIGNQGRKTEKYTTVVPGGTPNPQIVDVNREINRLGIDVLDYFMIGHMPLNLFAPGHCQIFRPDPADYIADGELVGEGYDRCVGLDRISECYLYEGEGGVPLRVEYATYTCPSGTICQFTADGSRCEARDGDRDFDGDGTTPNGGDCDDRDAAVYPTAPDNQCREGEEGFGIDNNCDGIIDDGCEADENPATCDTRGLTYEGAAPGGQCCGDDRDETWNLFTSASPATIGCFQDATIPVNGVNPANLAMGEWTRDSEGTDVIGAAGMYPINDELELSSTWAFTYVPAKQFHGKTMVWEFEYKDGSVPTDMFITVYGMGSDRSEGWVTRIQYTSIFHNGEWTKIRREFDYDGGSAAEASGLLIGIAKLTLSGAPKIRNFRVYPKDVEKVIYVDDQAYGCRAEGTPIASQRYNTPAVPSSSTAIPSANMKDRCEVVTSTTGSRFVCDNDGFWKETPHAETQLRSLWIETVGTPILCIPGPCPPRPPPPEPDYDIVSKTSGCCGGNSCWNGMSCTEDGDIVLDGESRMLCVAGEWQTEILKKDQYNHDAPTKACGSLQCFWNGESNLASAEDADDECVDNEEFKEDYQCVFGSWRSRTSMIAQQMLHMTDLGTRPDEYTLFCDGPERAVLNLEHSGPFAGIVRNAVYGTGDPADCGLGTGKPCVNNVCVLKFQQGGEEKVAVGMSLNKPIDVPHAEERGESILHFIPETVQHASYVEAADHYTYCDGVVQRESPGWVYYGCDGPDNAIVGSPTELWYNPKTKSIIYSPQGITVGRETAGTRIADALLNPLDTLFGAIRGWLGFEEREGIETDRSEVARRLKFDRLYIQRDDLQAIRGILQKDDIESGQDLMTVEYENIPADVCTNMNRICTEGENCKCEPTYIHKRAWIFPDWWRFMIKIKGALRPEFADKWDDLTAKTRLDTSVRPSGPGPDAPGIMHTVPTTTETPTRFIIRGVPDEEDIIGYYWIFEWRDGDAIGKGARTRREADGVSHLFSENGTYNVHLNVISKNFVVGQAQTTVTVPTGEAELEPWARELLAEEEARLCRERGICPERMPPSGFGGP